jgi:Zn-dependent peptidase ImmA (M78 family)
MTDDYRVQSRSDQEVRQLAKKLRAYFGVADCSRVNVLSCLKRDSIWTVRGVQRLNFQVRPDTEMGHNDGSTTFAKGIVTISVKQSVHGAALMGDGRSRNTLTHELGHGVMHYGPEMFRRMNGNVTPKFLKAYESAEHQAKVFAPAFLINDRIAPTLGSAEELSVHAGISLESSGIYWDALTEDRERLKNAERVKKIADKLAADFRTSDPSDALGIRYMQDICTVCREKKVFPIGIKFMCHNCKTVFDRYQDGDPG